MGTLSLAFRDTVFFVGMGVMVLTPEGWARAQEEDSKKEQPAGIEQILHGP
jgi:hypothetical protein